MTPKYPFDPHTLDALPEELAELFRGLELTLLEEICSRLKIADQLNEVTVQDIRALRSHGISLDEIKKAIKETTGVSEKKLDKLLDDVVAQNQAYYTELIDLAKVTTPQTLVDAIAIEAIRRQAFDEFRNITRSMGFLVDNGRTMLEPAQAYQWALDNAELQVQSGAISYNQAIQSAVRQLADSGLKTVNYESGHVDSADVAVRRAVMTGVNQLNSKYREQSMDYLDTDLVEVTAHLGARNIDGPNGWENHAEWQGKVYQWKVHGKNREGNLLTNRHDGGSIQSFENDIQIGRSLGAAAFRDHVKLPNGKIVKVAEGSTISKIVSFAGYGTKTPLRVASALASTYDVDAERWSHRRGDGYVDVDGVSRHAELHWFEHPDVGRVKMKVKRYFDNES